MSAAGQRQRTPPGLREARGNQRQRVDRCPRCNAELRWTTMVETGRKNPLNWDADLERGNVLLDDRGRGLQLRPATAAALRCRDFELYLCHYATSPACHPRAQDGSE